jgi:hypothetical protein
MNTVPTWTRYREMMLWAVITLLAAAVAVAIARVAGG